MRCPEGWPILTETLWHLPPSEARAFWGALSRARYTRPATFRHEVMLLGYVRRDRIPFVEHICTPAAVITILEDLAVERQ